MKRRSDPDDSPQDRDAVWEKLIGLGERSIKKSYFPELQDRLVEIERMRGFLAAIIDSMPSIIAGVDQDGRVTQWNRQAVQATGLSQDEAVGRPAVELLPLLAGHARMLDDALNGRQPEAAERIKISSGPAMSYYDIVVYPLISDVGRGAVIRIDDVTYKARIEEMMVQTEKMMSVGGLAAGMAHEINNPLGGILNAAQNILRRFAPNMAKNQVVAQQCNIDLEDVNCYLNERGILSMLSIIRESGERAARIVENMLTFSRRSESRKAPTNLGDLITNTIELASKDYDLKKRYDFRHVSVQTSIDPNLPKTPCSATEIEQVVLNILKNSAQAMAEKHYPPDVKPTINVQARQDGDWARIEIADNGPGMTTDIKKRIFEPFFTTKEVGVGTGLGLSVSYFIITKNHGGRLEVLSAPDEGARFIISLPLNPL